MNLLDSIERSERAILRAKRAKLPFSFITPTLSFLLTPFHLTTALFVPVLGQILFLINVWFLIMFLRAKGSTVESIVVVLSITFSVVLSVSLSGLFPRHLDMVISGLMALSLAVSLASCLSLLYGWFSVARYESVF